MTQRLILSALTVLVTMILSAGTAFAPPMPGGPTTPDYEDSFNESAVLDTTQVETADKRMESCDLWYFEDLDLLACK